MRNARRVAEDDRRDARLETPEGRDAYWVELQAECAKSSLIGLLEETLALPGDIVECGVFRGGSLKRIARAARDVAPGKTIYGCDSYEGFPEDSVGSNDWTFFRRTSRLKDKFAGANHVPDRLARFCVAFGVNGRIVKGYFSDTLPSLPAARIAFLHIDSDTYSSHVECLTTLYDRIVPGGIVVFDDYDQPKWPGAKKAIDEFFALRLEKPALSTARKNGAWFVRKP